MALRPPEGGHSGMLHEVVGANKKVLLELL
jgi:hypothetical protein